MAMYSHLTNLDVTTFLLLLRLLFLVGDVVPNFVRHFPPHLKNIVVSLFDFSWQYVSFFGRFET